MQNLGSSKYPCQYDFMVSTKDSANLLIDFQQKKTKPKRIIKKQDLCFKGVIFKKVNSAHRMFLRLMIKYFQIYLLAYLQTITDLTKREKIKFLMKKVLKDLKISKKTNCHNATLQILKSFFKSDDENYNLNSKDQKEKQRFYITRSIARDIFQNEAMRYVFERNKVENCLGHVILATQYLSRLSNPLLLDKIQCSMRYSAKEIKQILQENKLKQLEKIQQEPLNMIAL